MEKSINLQISQRGVITLPKALRQAYGLKTGDVLTLIDLGNAFVISPRRSEVDALADEINQALSERGETLEGMLKSLREQRESYGTKA